MSTVLILAYVPDLMDRSRLNTQVRDILFVKKVSDLTQENAALVVVDLSRPEVLEILPKINATTIGFVSHIDKKAIKAAEDAGCEKVLPRSKFFQSFSTLVNGVLQLF